MLDDIVRRRLEEITEARYGRFDQPPIGHLFLMVSGWWSGHLVHHRPAAEKMLKEVGIQYPLYDDVRTFIEHTFAIRAELLRGELNLQIEGYISRAQFQAVMDAIFFRRREETGI